MKSCPESGRRWNRRTWCGGCHPR